MKRWIILGLIVISFTFVSIASTENKIDQLNANLFKAICFNNIDEIEKCLKDGANVNAVDARGLTPLYHAMLTEDQDILSLLIKYGVDVNELIGSEEDYFGRIPPLVWVFKAGNKELTRFFLSKKANVNVEDSKGVPLVVYVVQDGDLEILRQLVTKGVDLHKRYRLSEDTTGTLLHTAVGFGHKDIVKYLLDKKLDIEARSSYFSPIMIAAQSGNLEISKLLVQRGANVFACRNFLLNREQLDKKTITYLNKIEQKYFLKDKPAWFDLLKKDGFGINGEDIDDKVLVNYIFEGNDLSGSSSQGNTLLHFAAAKRLKDTECLSVLLDDAGLDVNQANIHGKTPLHFASEEGCINCVEFLLNHDAKVDARDSFKNTPLINSDKKEIIELLLDAGADINAENVYGQTVLFQLSSLSETFKKESALVQLVIENGADVNHQTHIRRTALHEAMDVGSVNTVRYLMEAGARTDLRCDDGRTPLEMARYDEEKKLAIAFEYSKAASLLEAVYYSRDDQVEQFIREGADLEMVNDKSSTSVILAANNNDSEILKKLLDAGANINACNDDGYTALHYACERGCNDAAWVLLDYGADVAIRNELGETAYDLAVSEERYRTIQIFKDFHPAIKKLDPADMMAESEAVMMEEHFDSAMIEASVSQEQLIEMMKNEMLNQTDSEFNKLVIKGDEAAVLQALANQTAQLNVLDNIDMSPLMYAGILGYKNITSMLLKNGADVNLQNQMGYTVLHAVVGVAQPEMVKLLLDAGADPSLEGIDKVNALEIALLSNQTEIVDMIKQVAPDLKADMQDFQFNVEMSVEDMNEYEITFEDSAFEEFEVEFEKQHRDWIKDEFISHSDNPFHIAVISNDCNKVQELIQDNPDIVNAEDSVGRSPLSYAVSLDNLSMIQLLLENNADVNQIDSNISVRVTYGEDSGWGCLHYAVESGSVEMMKILIDAGADLEMKDKEYNRTPFLMAMGNGEIEVGKILMDAGANVSAFDETDNTALHAAVRSENFEIMNFLLDSGIDIELKNKRNLTPLQYACSWGSKDALIFLINKGADMNKLSNAMHYAISAYDQEIVKILFEYGIDVNKKNNKGQTPLFTAVVRTSEFRGDLMKNTEFLVQNGADINIQDNEGNTVLHIAADNCNKDFIEFAMKYGADLGLVNHEGRTPLLELTHTIVGECEECYLDLIKLMIENGADINESDFKGSTVLHRAVYENKIEVVDYLLENGADPDVKSEFFSGRVPLCIALNEWKTEMVEKLLLAGANTNISNRNGEVPLHLAVNQRSIDLIKMMLDNGADLDLGDRQGNTPLHYAVRNSSYEIAEYLVNAGARYDIENNYERTAKDIAETFNNKKILDLFQ